MYARDSRYRYVAEIVRADSSGRTSRVTDLRPRARAAGTFRHTIESGDRLDHLAQRYYGKPRAWWRICDANPEFASPLALLGLEAVGTVRMEIVPEGAALPPWSVLLRELRARPGVHDVGFETESRTVPGTTEEAAVEAGVVTVTFNRLTVTAGALAAAANAAGFPAGSPRPVGRVGREIVVPPEGVR